MIVFSSFVKSVFAFFFSFFLLVFALSCTPLDQDSTVSALCTVAALAASIVFSVYSFKRSVKRGRTDPKKAAATIGIYFFLALLFILGLLLFPVDSTNHSLAPDWYVGVIVFVPVLGAALYSHIFNKSASTAPKAAQADPAPQPANPFRQRIPSDIPRNKSARMKAAEKIRNDLSQHLQEAYSSDSVSLYYHYTESAKKDIEQLKKYVGYVPESYTDGIAWNEHMLRNNFLWKLRDCIEREKDDILVKIRGEYRNNKKSLCDSFIASLEMYKHDFDSETITFCAGIVKELSQKTGLTLSFSGAPEDPAPAPIPPEMASNICIVDRMSGEEFEHWCAQLLSDLGYQDVIVTKASGDQGVDILARFGDARYAIQCKCYSSNLGNSPIQEVAAGMKFYRCDIGVVLTNQYFTSGAKDLAMSIGIRLWDRDWLEKAIHSRAMKDR